MEYNNKVINNNHGAGALILTMITVVLLSAIISQMPALLSNYADGHERYRKQLNAQIIQGDISKIVLDARRKGLESIANGSFNCSGFGTGQYTPADANASNLLFCFCLLYTSPSPRDATLSRMPSSA